MDWTIPTCIRSVEQSIGVVQASVTRIWSPTQNRRFTHIAVVMMVMIVYSHSLGRAIHWRGTGIGDSNLVTNTKSKIYTHCSGDDGDDSLLDFPLKVDHG